MHKLSILVVGAALCGAPALILARSPDFPGDLNSPLPSDLGPDGSQFERYGGPETGTTPTGSACWAAQYPLCGLDATLNLGANFTGARPPGTGCSCARNAMAAVNQTPSTRPRAVAGKTGRPGRNRSPVANYSHVGLGPPRGYAGTHASAGRSRASGYAARAATPYPSAPHPYRGRVSPALQQQASYRPPAQPAPRAMPRTSLPWIPTILAGISLTAIGLALRPIFRA